MQADKHVGWGRPMVSRNCVARLEHFEQATRPLAHMVHLHPPWRRDGGGGEAQECTQRVRVDGVTRCRQRAARQEHFLQSLDPALCPSAGRPRGVRAAHAMPLSVPAVLGRDAPPVPTPDASTSVSVIESPSW